MERQKGTGVIINARMVGSPDTVIEKVKDFNKPGVKLIAVTYCQTPEEQSKVYDCLKSCKDS